MGNVTSSFIRVDPSYIMPDILMQYNQASGAYEMLGGNAPQVRLADGDLYAYIKKFDIRTKIAAGQTAYNSLPSVSVVASMISTPTYLTRVRAEYDHHDTAAMNNWGASIVEAQRLGMRQGTFQQMRNALLFGFNPAQGEGFMNTAGATAINLPADSNGNTTLLTYDNGQLAIFFLAQIQAIKTRCMQLGIPVNITILGPQRVLGAMEYQNIVQLTQFQRVGAGTATTAGTINAVVEENNDSITWAYDDTLIAKGAGGVDAVLIGVTRLESPRENPIDTNAFAALAPNLAATGLQLCDMAAPREIPTPLPGGAIDVLAELRITSGWFVRPEALTILSIQYQ